MHTHVRGIQPVILRRTCPIHRECAGYICAALCFSGTMPHARCASHRNGAVHDMVQPPLQSPAVHPHGTASQIETRDHMRIDHKAASGIVNNFIRYQKAGICGSHDADQHVCCCTAGSQNTAGTVHTAYSYRAGRVQAKCSGATLRWHSEPAAADRFCDP